MATEPVKTASHLVSYPRFLWRVVALATDGSPLFYAWMTLLTAVFLVGVNAWAHQVSGGISRKLTDLFAVHVDAVYNRAQGDYKQLDINAVDPATGTVLWETPAPADGCTTGGAAGEPACAPGHGVPVSSTPGVVWLGAQDGKFRAYSAKTGQILWTYVTVQDTQGVNGLIGRGGVIGGAGSGAVVSRGMVYVQSGHWLGYPSPHGRVLLAFGL